MVTSFSLNSEHVQVTVNKRDTVFTLIRTFISWASSFLHSVPILFSFVLCNLVGNFIYWISIPIKANVHYPVTRKTSEFCLYLWLIDFNSVSTCPGLFYALPLGNRTLWSFIFIFLYTCFLRVFAHSYMILDIPIKFIWLTHSYMISATF